MTRYRLTLTPEQARTVIDALDLYIRIGLGQLNRIPDVADPLGNRLDPEATDRAIDELKRTLFPDLSTYSNRSIASPRIPHDCRIVYEILCVTIREIARVEGHPNASVWNGEPMRVTGEPLATCEAVEGDGR